MIHDSMVCAAKGYPFVAVMSDSFSVERRKLLKALGAKVILTPAAEGWNPDFVPAIFNRSVYDEAVLVGEVEARDAAGALAHKEGIFCGISSGGTFAAAVKVAAKAKEGSVLLAMLPDTGERYLTTFLFEGITEASDEWRLKSKRRPCQPHRNPVPSFRARPRATDDPDAPEDRP